jgi:Zn-dependent M16 (insulinase) family peptidase
MASTFELIRTQRIDTLNVEMQQYRHASTGAVHYHLAAEDNNNCFMVAFPTVPMDHTGVAHILEHTVLCGSRKYPVRDPFFMMLRRSLNTFMNAFTSSDATAYPFATQNRKDFENLLSVYLDAVFFPKIDPMDFAQEGHRIEFATPGDPASPLVYRGVVYNEMKGAMSSPIAQVQMELQSLLFPTTTYHYNSGGDPEHIPSLTYEQLVAFHRSHYHPSNATFMTYGDFPVRDHQAMIEDWALKHFDRRALDLHLHDERRYGQPLRVESFYTHDGGDTDDAQSYVAMGWLLGHTGDARHFMHDLLLSNVLLQHSGSPLRHALETTELGTAPLELCGLDDSAREAMFVCGLEGARAEDADRIEALIIGVLERIAREGVPQDTVDAVLTQLEIAQRELGGGHFPHGLQLLTRILGATTHGGDPFAFLNVDAAIAELREEIRDPEFIKHQVRRLLDNPHRVRLVMSPDPGLAKRREQAERKRLDAIAAALDSERRREIIEQAGALDERQRHGNNPDLLPKVGIADVPNDMRIPVGREAMIERHPASWYPAGTNGLVYMQWVADLPALTREQTEALVLFYSMLPEIGSGGRDYVATQALQARLGTIGAQVSLRASVGDLGRTRGIFAIAGKSLARDQQALAQLVHDTVHTTRFDEPQRVRELIAQLRAAQESSVTDRGHSLAMIASAAGMGAVGQLDNLWDGPLAIAMLKELDDRLDDRRSLEEFCALLRQVREKVAAQPPRLLVVAPESEHASLHSTLARTFGGDRRDGGGTAFAWSSPVQRINDAWLTNTQVNFCARAYPAVPSEHPDAPVLSVLGKFLHNGYLHRAIREQGGAYGSGARYDADSGSFKFFSYRDPRLEGTLDDFDAALEWLQGPHADRELEEAVLGVIQAIDQPSSPSGEAIQAYFQSMHGRTPDFRRRYRAGVLRTTLSDLQRVGNTYLKPEHASTAVITNRDTLDRHKHLRLDAHNI